MGPFALLALLTGNMLLGALEDGGGNTAPETSGEPDTPDLPQDPLPPPPPEEPDVGAAFDVDPSTGAVSLDLGDDETDTLASIIYVDSEDNPTNVYQTYEARFYLVPEGANLSDQGFENKGAIPGLQDFGGNSLDYELAEFEAQLGLELLGTVDLDLPESGRPLPEPGTMRDVLPQISSNADVAVHYLEANTDGDDLIRFLNEDYIVTRNGVTEQVVTEDTTGTAGADWLTAGASGLALDGGEGNDTLVADFADTTLTGGVGDDTFEGVFAERGQGFSRIDGTEPGVVIVAGDGNDNVSTSNATVDAGAGDDSVTMFGGEARGGEGDDRLNARGPGLATLYGDAGNDRLFVSGEGSEAFGGEGADFIGANAGTLGDGGFGNDTLQLDPGGTGIGGAGDDMINVMGFYDDEDGPATVTGGEGEDTISALVRGGFGAPEYVYLEIADFDTDEDILQIGSFGDGAVTNIDIVQNPGDNVTDVRVSFAPTSNIERGMAIIRINGLSDITEDQIILT
ncbi:hypothetical protein [uncultured Tateyamaria sp.]|uniref:calcium-binding protein n=1 Tax=uncultured Tateyamaria sp. TaxID=455651 RepID=UPI0026280CB9|nr:hypothetical protein [uncultured Tateyamaria sp.]